jgi:hypothetical protein
MMVILERSCLRESMVDTLLVMVPQRGLGEVPGMSEMVIVKGTMVMVIKRG